VYRVNTIGSMGDASPLDAWKNALPGLALDPSWVPGAIVNPDGTVVAPPGYQGPPLVSVLPPIKKPTDQAPAPAWQKPAMIGGLVLAGVVLVLALGRLT